jgi:hypothetical protein
MLYPPKCPIESDAERGYSILKSQDTVSSNPERKIMVDDMEFARLRARVSLLEDQMKFLLDRLNLEYIDNPSPSFPDVVALKRQGKLIDAIKLYREKTNAGLAEAKEFVDKL